MKKNALKKITAATLGIYLALGSIFVYFEDHIIEAADDTVAVSLSVTTEITLACDATTTLAGVINSMTGGTATSTFGCLIKTPNSDGYNMTVLQDHTLQIAGGGANKEFSNYATSTAPIDYDWVAPAAGAEIFGFSMHTGTVQAAAAYKNNGATCNAGSTVNGINCWNGFTTSPQKVVSSAVPSDGAGDAANFMLKAQAGASNFLTNGTYENVITLTATTGS